MGAFEGLILNRLAANEFMWSRASNSGDGVKQVTALVIGVPYVVSVKGNARDSVKLTGQVTATVKPNIPFTFTASATTLSYEVVGTPIHIQIERGAEPTEDIWTDSVRAQRENEDMFINGLQASGQLGANAGTLYMRVSRFVGIIAGSAWLDLYRAGETSLINGMSLLTPPAINTGRLRYQIYKASSVMADVQPDVAITLKNGGAMIITWNATSIKLFVNGVKIGEHTNVGLTNIDGFRLNAGSGAQIKLLRYAMLNRIVTDAEGIEQSLL